MKGSAGSPADVLRHRANHGRPHAAELQQTELHVPYGASHEVAVGDAPPQ